MVQYFCAQCGMRTWVLLYDLFLPVLIMHKFKSRTYVLYFIMARYLYPHIVAFLFTIALLMRT